MKTILSVLLPLLCSLFFNLDVAFCSNLQQKVTAESQQKNKGFFEEREKGWFFYEKQKEDAKIKKDNKTITTMQKPEIPWERLYNMPPKEFNKLIDDVRDYAISFPTVDNVKDYMKLQNIAIERSEKFQNVFTFVAQTDPSLTSEKSYPVATAGQDEYHYKKYYEAENYIKSKKNHYGLLYFYSTRCIFCEKQTPIINIIQKNTNMDILKVDYDTDLRAKYQFGISSVPSIVLVSRKTKDWLLISSGLIDGSELTFRIYRSMKYLEGERSVEDFAKPDFFEGK